MTDADDKIFQQLCDHARQTALLSSTVSLLGWDERTGLPAAAAEHRAEQMTLLAGMVHGRNTAAQLGQWLEELSASPLAEDPHSDAGTVIRQIKRQYDKQRKLPQLLVEELTRTAIEGQQVWQKARENNDYRAFQPVLKKTLDLKRRQADAMGFDECRYDALLDDFEPEEKTSNVRRVLGALRDELVPLIHGIAVSSHNRHVDLLHGDFPVAAQEQFGHRTAELIGFDFNRGRLDTTIHPFCTNLGPHDTRITTRYDERFFGSAFFGILHEAGHGIYEQGLRPEWYGLPPGETVSLGIHESQSRMWENQVGRSRAFWEHQFGSARTAFPHALTDASLEDFYFAVNDVRPSLVRVEADEATYNLHILIRFELEQELLDDDLAVEDLPQAWNDRYQQYLGVKPKTDTEGVLQDIHWSSGAFGYFSTYSLGNLYAAQFFAQADKDLGGLASLFASGQFQLLRNWLAENIHYPGQCYTQAELVQRVTGQPLSHHYLMDYLRAKYQPLYGIG